jgi:predicted cupin superfamily sugar epimerase
MTSDQLINHPEGGRFLEVFRSPLCVETVDGKERSAVTHIYFALAPGEVSCFHKVTSDEVWNLYEGEGVRLYLWDGESDDVKTVELSRSARNYCHVIAAGVWQAAEPMADSILVGCSVAPGFEFSDFEMLRHGSAAASRLLAANDTLDRFFAAAE